MKSFLKIAALTLPALLAAPLSAQVAPATTSPASVAIVDLNAAVGGSAAAKAAATQIEATYKTQITAFQTRQSAINAELTPLRNEIETLQRNPATPKATLDAKIAAFQSRGQTAQTELQRLAQPFGRAQAYVKEQIQAKLEPALKAAMAAKKVQIILSSEAVTYATGGDLTADVVTQLNALVPSASITPPANWQPGQGDQAAAPGR